MRTLPLSRLVPVALSAVVAVGGACVTDPARHLEESGDDVEITPNGSFIRGDDHLDEEEFYSLVGDKESAEKIRAERAQGEMFQPVGVALGLTGAGMIVGGLGYYVVTTSGSNAKPILGGTGDTLVYYAAFFGGLAGAVGGGYLWYDGNQKASGKNRMFDVKHATASLESARYGSGGATQSTVASVELATKSGAQSFCTVGATALKPLVAKDEKGRNIKLDASRAGWFQWTSNPDGVLTQTRSAVVSPLGTSLAALGKDVIVTVKVDAPTNVQATLDLKPDFGCPKPWFNFEGGGGGSGNFGDSGQGAGSEGQAGGPGGPGGPGGDGARGLDVTVEATSLRGPGGEDLVLAAVSTHGGGVNLAVFDPKTAGPLLIAADGGPGGSGGRGGGGGNGWAFGSGDTCRPGGAGGTGGNGGPGGRGGDGGHVRIRADSKAALAAVRASVQGGAPGGGGFGGNGGGGGDGDSCGSDRAARGADGAGGAGGGSGTAGREGRVDAGVAPRGSLHMIKAALKSAR